MIIVKTKYIHIASLVTIGIVVYLSSLNNGLLDFWDDQWMVKNHFTEQGWDLQNLYDLFTQSYNGQYSPLAELNYMLVYSFFGYNPIAYHFLSLLWHIGCSILIYLLIIKFLQLYLKDQSKHYCLIAFITAVLFVVHPVNVESVSWASALKVLVYAFFYLSATLFYIKYIQTSKFFHFFCSVSAFIASCMSKEQAVVLPILLLAVDWFADRDWKNPEIWIEKTPYFIIAFGFGFLTLSLQKEKIGEVSYTVVERILFSCYSIFEYITKSIFPVRLNYLYPYPISTGEPIAFNFYLYPILIITLAIWFIFSVKKNIYFFCIVFFLIHISTSIHIFPLPRFSITSDRYMYLSLTGMLFFISYSMITFVKNNKNNTRRIITSVLIALYSLYLFQYTFRYSQKWENTSSVKEYLNKYISI